MIEAAAERLSIDVASILMRNPEDPEAIWSIWDQPSRASGMIIDIARTILKTGT